MGRAFRALKASAKARKTKRMQLKYVDRLNNDALVGKCFNNLLYFAQRSRRTRSAYNEVTKYRSQKIRRQCLLTMLIVFNKQRLLRQLFEEVEEKHRNRMARAAFMRWLSRRQKLVEAERVLKEVRRLTMKHDLFKLWRCKYLMGSQVKQGLSDFCRQRKHKLLRNSFHGLRDELKATTHRKEMKKLCSFIFLKNLLKKCYGALGYNRFYQKQKKRAPLLHPEYMKFKVFQRLKTKWLKNKKSIDNRKRLALKMQIRTFRYLEERWRYNKLLRAKFLEMMAGKDEYYLTMCFSCLKNWKQLKAELQRRSMPVHLDDHEYFKARFVMERWKLWHGKRVKNRETRAKLEA